MNRQRESLEQPSDEDLLTRIRSGDQESFGYFVRRYERELYGYLYRYTGDAELAADVFQNTFIAVFTKIQQYEPGRSARPWLYAIATNQAIDAMRKQARQLENRLRSVEPNDLELEGSLQKSLMEYLSSRSPDPAIFASEEEVRVQVRLAVEALPETLKQVVLLTYFQGLKYQDAAEILGVPLGTVKSRLNAAMSRLTAAWTTSYPGATPEDPMSRLSPNQDEADDFSETDRSTNTPPSTGRGSYS